MSHWTFSYTPQWLKAVEKLSDPTFLQLAEALKLMAAHGPRYRGLKSHALQGVSDVQGNTIWVSYIDKRYRFTWTYTKGKRQDITLRNCGDHDPTEENP